ncbi:MAG: hypothetical protein GY810_23490 [Aureispira sp.]|nr:hypothetical protein [Aureispira sp.]
MTPESLMGLKQQLEAYLHTAKTLYKILPSFAKRLIKDKVDEYKNLLVVVERALEKQKEQEEKCPTDSTVVPHTPDTTANIEKGKALEVTLNETKALLGSLAPDEKGKYLLITYTGGKLKTAQKAITDWDREYTALGKDLMAALDKAVPQLKSLIKKLKPQIDNVLKNATEQKSEAAKNVDALDKKYTKLQSYIKKVDALIEKHKAATAPEITEAERCELLSYGILMQDFVAVVDKTTDTIVAELFKKHSFPAKDQLEKQLTEREQKVNELLKKAQIKVSKNDLGLSEEQVTEKMDKIFKAFDELVVEVTINDKKQEVGVQTPYHIGKGVKSGKGDPVQLQKWLQEQVNSSSKIKKEIAKKKGVDLEKELKELGTYLRKYMDDNKAGIDCSGFVTQVFNHIADKDGDVERGKDDVFNPIYVQSTELSTLKYGEKEVVKDKATLTNKLDVPNGSQTFVKIKPTEVKTGDTLYYHNADGVDHIRVVRDVKYVGNVVFYTIYESAGGSGPREKRWKYENDQLYQLDGETWKRKKHNHFSRWTKMDNKDGVPKLAMP